MRHLRLLAAAATLLTGVAVAAPVATAAVPALPRIAASQELVVLVGPHIVRQPPLTSGPRVTTVGALRPITGERTTLPVLGRATDMLDRQWLHVRLPGRMNGGRPQPPAGWILAAGTRRTATPWHLVVDTSARRLDVYLRGRRVRRFSAIVGAPATPTPHGTFFVEENVKMPPGSVGAPFALAMSARSKVLYEFAGGPGQIAVHGLRGVGGQLGTAASHGCVRLANWAVTWVAQRIGPGVPITIVY
jgi:lipoprotein-anchoring transpeptidase ErfK/SrfK